MSIRAKLERVEERNAINDPGLNANEPAWGDVFFEKLAFPVALLAFAASILVSAALAAGGGFDSAIQAVVVSVGLVLVSPVVGIALALTLALLGVLGVHYVRLLLFLVPESESD
jgi:hypothetical protein